MDPLVATAVAAKQEAAKPDPGKASEAAGDATRPAVTQAAVEALKQSKQAADERAECAHREALALAERLEAAERALEAEKQHRHWLDVQLHRERKHEDSLPKADLEDLTKALEAELEEHREQLEKESDLKVAAAQARAADEVQVAKTTYAQQAAEEVQAKMAQQTQQVAEAMQAARADQAAAKAAQQVAEEATAAAAQQAEQAKATQAAAAAQVAEAARVNVELALRRAATPSVERDSDSERCAASVVGSGAFASVYMVCEKVAKPTRTARLELAHELELFRHIQGPGEAAGPCEHVVRLLGAGQHRGELYLRLEAFGEDLFDKLSRRRTGLRDSEALHYAKQCLLGLRWLHDRGVAHGDIKCENLLVKYGHLKLTDLGAGQFTEDMRKRPVPLMKGTFETMAPELFEEDGCDEKVDVWAVGIVLYSMLTLRVVQSDKLRANVNKLLSLQAHGASDDGLRAQSHAAVWAAAAGIKPLSPALEALLTPRAERPSVHEALELAWFQQASQAPESESDEELEEEDEDKGWWGDGSEAPSRETQLPDAAEQYALSGSEAELSDEEQSSCASAYNNASPCDDDSEDSDDER